MRLNLWLRPGPNPAAMLRHPSSSTSKRASRSVERRCSLRTNCMRLSGGRVLSECHMFCFILSASSLYGCSQVLLVSLVLSCLVLSCLVLSCLVLSCLVLSCLVLSCLVLSCLVLSCLVLSCLVFAFRPVCSHTMSPGPTFTSAHVLVRAPIDGPGAQPTDIGDHSVRIPCSYAHFGREATACASSQKRLGRLHRLKHAARQRHFLKWRSDTSV